ncbi:MAG: sugar-binding domain-containing protein, partial [Actinomycetota bacterium]
MDPVAWRTLLTPEILDVGRLPSRASFDPYPDRASALADDQLARTLSLDGSWDFRLLGSPDEAPDGWAAPDFEPAEDTRAARDRPWRTIEVPGCWTRQDTGDLPHYTNVIMPWSAEPPDFPDDNPTGLHRRWFRLPSGWKRRRTVVQFGGHESVALVWCNGTFVGMGKDSRLASEFDLTSHLQAGRNLLAVMVIRWSDSTWIEDQDHWYHAGLHRPVRLLSTPARHLADVATTSDFDPTTGAGSLTATVDVGGPEPADGAGVVRLTLLDGPDRGAAELATVETPIGSSRTEPGGDVVLAAASFRGARAKATIDLASARPWSAEVPNRYRLVVELLDADGEPTEATTVIVGFTRVEIAEG